MLLIAGFVLAWRGTAFRKPLLVAAGMVVGGGVDCWISQLRWPAWSAPAISGGPIRSSPISPFTRPCCWQWGWSGGAGAALWTVARMRAAAWLLILIVGSALSLALPGASIFFLIAPAIALAGIAVSNRSPFAANILVTVAIVVQFVMFAELLALIEMLLIDGPLAAVVLLAALAALPAMVEVDRKASRLAVVSALIAAAGLWIGAMIVPRSSAERPLAIQHRLFPRRDPAEGQLGSRDQAGALASGLSRPMGEVGASLQRPHTLDFACAFACHPSPARAGHFQPASGAGRRVRIVALARRRQHRSRSAFRRRRMSWPSGLRAPPFRSADRRAGQAASPLHRPNLRRPSDRGSVRRYASCRGGTISTRFGFLRKDSRSWPRDRGTRFLNTHPTRRSR